MTCRTAPWTPFPAHPPPSPGTLIHMTKPTPSAAARKSATQLRPITQADRRPSRLDIARARPVGGQASGDEHRGRPRYQTLRMTATTLPRIVASSPGTGVRSGLRGISHVWPPARLYVVTGASPPL